MIQNPNQGERAIVVNDQTAFMKDGKPSSLKDLKPGDRMMVIGKETDGQSVASRVMTGRFGMGRGGARIGAPPQGSPEK